MERYESLHHTKWECKYHLVWIPKCRKKVLYGQLRRDLGPILRKLALQKESEVVEGMLKVDHVHMVVSIPPKYSVSQVVGYMKGKSAIWVARATGRSRNFVTQNFWACGYCVSRIDLDEETIREYVRSQEKVDKKLDEMKMFE
jgi:putative transposase